MLTEEEKREIEKEIRKQEYPKAACVEVLRVLQAGRGWVSDEGIRDAAPLLGMTPEELDAVATFYPFIFRRPVGRHVIFICDAVSCWVMGYGNLLEHLERRLGITLGETTPDGRFTLLPISCLGACDCAPAVMIDRDLHGDLTPQKIDGLLERYE
ncbi:MAG TPA: NADH-quinone oxidoreductase subunit NuoE [Syntrophales bacterium]|jgi:NADH-quinone oxidoreductase subunit E|nr:NADH-quinone oxidoreductase subunit NuoE [Syntrophales bacterium]HRT60817.1 NADH-quinone oxidoreductase subunit NuoE [Syntrophales bacterium]